MFKLQSMSDLINQKMCVLQISNLEIQIIKKNEHKIIQDKNLKCF